MLHRLVYASRANLPMQQHDLLKILDSARAHNVRTAITGMLVYANGDFLQVLEGEQIDIEALYARICADARHRNCRVLSDSEIQERIFSDWSMGFREIDKSDLTQIAGFIDFFNPDMTPKPLVNPSSVAQFFLLGFRALCLQGQTPVPTKECPAVRP